MPATAKCEESGNQQQVVRLSSAALETLTNLSSVSVFQTITDEAIRAPQLKRYLQTQNEMFLIATIMSRSPHVKTQLTKKCPILLTNQPGRFRQPLVFDARF